MIKPLAISIERIRSTRVGNKFPSIYHFTSLFHHISSAAAHYAARGVSQVLLVHVFSILLFALTVNIDNFTAGTVYGMRRIKIGSVSNLIIGLISGVGTILSMLLGRAIGRFFPTDLANTLGNALLIVIGLWFAASFVKKTVASTHRGGREPFAPARLLNRPEEADADHFGFIDTREATLLALALTINNFGMGLGTSIAGYSIWGTSAAVFVCSLLTIRLGCLLGQSLLASFLGKYNDLISGLVLIVLGVTELFL